MKLLKLHIQVLFDRWWTRLLVVLCELHAYNTDNERRVCVLQCNVKEGFEKDGEQKTVVMSEYRCTKSSRRYVRHQNELKTTKRWCMSRSHKKSKVAGQGHNIDATREASFYLRCRRGWWPGEPWRRGLLPLLTIDDDEQGTRES